MPKFSYIARSAKGEKIQGSLEAGDRRAVMVQLDRMGLIPVTITEGAAPASSSKPGKPTAVEAADEKPKRMKMRDLLNFTGELSDLLTSGMTLGNALNTLARRKTKGGHQAIITELRDEIVQGSSLSEALAKRPDTFQNLYVSMVKAGEASGDLGGVLVQLRKHYERTTEARDKVVSALTYPAIVLVAGIGTMIFTMTFVVPQFSSIFAELGGTLPLPTRMLLGLSNAMISYGWIVVALAVFGFTSFKKWAKTPEGEMKWHKAQLRMPVISTITTTHAFGHFARTLSALLRNGVPVLQALSIVEKTMGNAAIAAELKEARERVTDGSSISQPLAAGKIFPAMLTDMLAVGEETGDMPGSLDHIARRYDQELDRAVKVLTTVLEPILIVVIAIMVGFIAVSMLMAVFSMANGLNV